MKKRWTITIALVFGASIAWLALPHVRDRMAIAAITNVDAETRDEGWTWLIHRIEHGDFDSQNGLLDRIASTLGDADSNAILEAGDMLRSLEVWDWNRLPAAILTDEALLLAFRDDEADQQLALSMLAGCPLDLDEQSPHKIFIALLMSEHPAIQHAALDEFCQWAGPDRIHLLEFLDPLDMAFEKYHTQVMYKLEHTILWTPRLLRKFLLALSWSDRRPRKEWPLYLEADPTVLELLLLNSARRYPEDLKAILDPHRAESLPWPVKSYILAQIKTPWAREGLDDLARSGVESARSVLRALDHDAVEAQARKLSQDDTEEAWRRRLGAWQCDEIDEQRVMEILDLDPAEFDGSVFSTALLAERHLEHGVAQELTQQWITSFNDDRKRAGALLAALLGVHTDLLRIAYEAEDRPDVKTIQRLALMALGEHVGDDDPIEFAYRTLHKKDGDFDADALMCLLLTGYVPALEYLTSEPKGDWRLAVQQRDWLIERFAGQWHEAAGRPIGGEVRSARLHFDSLDALRLLTIRRLSFDCESRSFSYAAP